MSSLTHHKVLRTPLHPPFPSHLKQIMFGMGCYWGAEKAFWQLNGVYTTHVGFSGGRVPNPTYEQVCNGRTGHNEVVRVVYDPAIISIWRLLKVFWEGHDPTQGNRQGNDVGDNYRSAIYTYSEEDLRIAERSKAVYQEQLKARRFEKITTEINMAEEFYYGPDDHQQYLHDIPWGYCGHGHTGVHFEFEGI